MSHLTTHILKKHVTKPFIKVFTYVTMCHFLKNIVMYYYTPCNVLLYIMHKFIYIKLT